MSTHQRWRHGIFRRFLVSYLAVLLLSLVLASIAYVNAFQEIQDAEIKNRRLLLTHTSRLLDDYFVGLSDMATQIGTNRFLMEYLYRDRLQAGSRDVWPLILAQKNLSAYTVTSPFKETLFLLFTHSELVLSRTFVNYGFDYAYEHVFSYLDTDFETFREEYFGSPRYGVFLPPRMVTYLGDEAVPMITYLQTIPPGSREVLGTIAIFIEEETIHGMLSSVLGDAPGWAFIIDGEYGVLSEARTSETELSGDHFRSMKLDDAGYSQVTVDGMPVVVAAEESEHGSFRYLLVLPEQEFFATKWRTRQVVFTMISLAAISGVGLSFFMSRRNAKPLGEAAALLREVSDIGGDDEYELLTRSVGGLVHSNSELKELVQRQSSALENSFLHHLIRGDFGSEQKVDELRLRAGIGLDAPPYAVYVLSFAGNALSSPASDGDAREVLAGALLDRLIVRNVALETVPLVLRPGSIAVVVALGAHASDQSSDVLQQQARSVLDAAEIELGISGIAGIGGTVERLMDVHESYQQAVAAQGQYSDAAQRIRHYREHDGHEPLHYPVEVEAKLIAYTRAGNSAEVSRLLDRLFTALSASDFPPSASVLRFYRRLVTTAERLAEEHGHLRSALDLLVEESIALLDWQETFAALRRVFVTMCGLSNSHKRSHNQRLLDGIRQFLEEEYANPDLSVSFVAERFGISGAYLSQFFSEQTGQRLSAFLEEVRMDAARARLSADPTASVEQIANEVGYRNPRTFRRAFKRATGVAPSRYSAVS